MKYKYSRIMDTFCLAIIWFFCFVKPAQAYFDLNMCSYIFQLIFGLGAAFWFSFKSSLARTIFKKKHKETVESITAKETAKIVETE